MINNHPGNICSRAQPFKTKKKVEILIYGIPESLIESFLQFGFSANEVKLSTALAYAVAGALCMGWLALLSYSIASMLTLLF